MFRADEVIGEYRLERPLGDGALAVVWIARRIDRDERVALKLTHPDRVPDSARKRAYEALTRALTECGRLEHPNLQAVFGLALRPEDGVFGIAARHYDGGAFENLGNLARRDTLVKALGLVRQTAEVLAWLHERDLVHGDLKPSNALITPGLSGPRVVLTDLVWSRAGLGRRTESTRIFVSPEQLAKQAPTAASDQWATARIMHQLAVHSTPGASQTEALTRMPLPVLRVLKRALEHDPRARFASMDSFVGALEHAEEELGSAGASAPSALPTPTLEVSVADAVAVSEDPTGRLTRPDPNEVATQQPELEIIEGPEASTFSPEVGLPEDPTPQALLPARDAPTEPGMPKPQVRTASEVEALAPPPEDVDAGGADPSAEQGDPTTPLSVQAINPSGERDEPPAPRRAPLQPSDPTDVLAPVVPAKSGPSKVALTMMALALLVIAASGVILWRNTAMRGEAVAVAAIDPAAATKAGEKTAPDSADPAPAKPVAPAPAKAPEPAKVAKAAPAKAAPAPKAAPASKAAGAGALVASAAAPAELADPLAALRAQCDAKRRKACAKLGQAYLQGDGVPKSSSQARRAFGRACDLRLISSCERAGSMYAATGRATDARRARRYLERSCDAGRASACGALAALWRDGRGGAANPRTADAFARRACSMGHRASCQ